ncbi:hypothetical protein [Shewanella sp. LZH-2]|uniref:hypothetical protein n=1 Tax=Shewanella sp. LZH-2 TaxID=2806008 RepID=UPI00193CD6D4|nr:hypothetical protein [Shewanella sp. LZH-2]QRK80801.1 hypothetical protein JM642_06830 [Shewanella sp. LZH-2]
MIYDNSSESKKVVNETQVSVYDLLYSSFKFNIFNQSKVEYIYTHFDNKISMIFGVNNGRISAPFSAPFSFIRYSSEYLKYSHIYSFFCSLKNSFLNSEIQSLKITLPPSIYNESIISKISHSLGDLGFKLSYRDLNSHINLNEFEVSLLPSSTKKAIRQSSKYECSFIKADSINDIRRAFDIINENRRSKGYPLRMSWDQMLDTINSVAKAHVFIAKVDGEEVASAFVFEVNNDIAQVIYWGATDIGENKNVMYFLPFQIFSYFKELGFRLLDIGPSSEFGVVSNGLNDYKQLIGCITSIKETWIIDKND